jgi:RNA polymerase subunit RPABC4/transcription elongation factor Spt4
MTKQPAQPQQPAAETLKCKACDSPFTEKTFKCPVCGATQNTQSCTRCRKQIPLEANYCSSCNSYQGWIRRHFAFSSVILSLLTAALSVLSIVLPQVNSLLNRHSHAVITFTSVTEEAIFVRITNTGGSPSVLRESLLTFSDGRISSPVLLFPRTADAKEGKAFVPAGQATVIGLTAQGMGSSVPHEQLAGLLSSLTVTLEMRFQESDSPEGNLTSRRESFPASRISEFVLAKVPEIGPSQ